MTSLDLIALLPVLVLALGSTAVLMAGAWWPAHRFWMWVGVLLAIVAISLAWSEPAPIAEVAGMFGTGAYARFFTGLWSLCAALTLIFSLRYGFERGFAGGEYTSLVLFAATGMSLLSAATSLVGLFLGLEAYTLVLYILISYHKGNPLGAEAGLKYLVLGALSTGFLAFGIALIYTVAGTFHLPQAMMALSGPSALRPLGMVGLAMIVVALGFKVSLVPFHLWTPDVYQGAPAPVVGLLSTGSKGAVFAALITLLAGTTTSGPALGPVLWVLAAASMLVGTVCALRQDNVKRMLAYSSVVHMGYVLVALEAGGSAGRSAVVFYLVVYALVNLGAFGVITSFSVPDGEPQTYDDYRGAGYHHPFRAAALTLFMLSLAGIPPTAGFIGKFGIFYAAIDSGYFALAILGVLASLVSLYYYLRLVIVMFMTDEETAPLRRAAGQEQLALAGAAATTLILGVFPGPLLDFILKIVS